MQVPHRLAPARDPARPRGALLASACPTPRRRRRPPDARRDHGHRPAGCSRPSTPGSSWWRACAPTSRPRAWTSSTPPARSGCTATCSGANPGPSAPGPPRDLRPPAGADQARDRAGGQQEPRAVGQEVVRADLLEELLELLDDLVGVLDLVLELDPALLDDLVGGEDGGVACARPGPARRSGGSRSRSRRRRPEGDQRVEGVLAQLGDRDLGDLGAQLARPRR